MSVVVAVNANICDLVLLLVARLEKAALVVIATFKTRIMPNKHTKLLLLLFLLLLLLYNEFIVCVVAICIMRD